MRLIVVLVALPFVVVFFLVAANGGEIKKATDLKAPLLTPHNPAMIGTKTLDGVPVSSVEENLKMQPGKHILQARGGKPAEEPAEKRMPPAERTVLPAGSRTVQVTSSVETSDGTGAVIHDSRNASANSGQGDRAPARVATARWKPAKQTVEKEGETPTPKWSVPATKRARMEARNSRRRIIYNDDAGELEHEGADTVEGFLEPRLRALAGTQVDTIAWSILSEWGDAPSYDSRVQPLFGKAQGTPPTAGHGHFHLNLESLINSGHCPLQIVIDFAHENGMEAFASVRMNDCHDSIIEPSIRTLWKRQHPELLVSTEGMLTDGTKALYVTAQDFSHREVRQRKFEILEEVCRRYDVDGFELDFIRHPVFFSPTMRGEPVTREQVEIMTRFQRRIRKLTDETAATRGRALLLAVSVPDTLQLAKDIGLDVETWLKEDLIDILIVGRGYAPHTLRVADITRLAHKHGIPVYPCINQKPPRYEVMTQKALLANRGLAANWYREGVDGIYFWNLGVPITWPLKTGEELIRTRKAIYKIVDEVGDPRTLAGKDKLFGFDGPVLHHYVHVTNQPPLPVDLKEGNIERLSLVVGDDVEASSRDGRVGNLGLRMTLEGPVEREALLFRLNGKTLSGGEFSGPDAEQKTILKVSLTPSWLKVGENIIEAGIRKGTGARVSPVKLSGIELLVDYE